MSLAVKVQLALGIILVAGLIALSAGLQIVPVDPESKALFNRIVDAMFIVLNIPLIASMIAKKEVDNEKADSFNADNSNS